MEFGEEGQSLARLRAPSTPRASAASRRCPPTTTSCSRRRGSTAPRRWPPWSNAPGGWRWRRPSRCPCCAARSRWPRRSRRSTSCPTGGWWPASGRGPREKDYDAVGIPFEERWPRFDEAVTALRALLGRASRARARGPRRPGRHPAVDRELGLASAGLRRVARRATAGSRPPTTRRRSASRRPRAWPRARARGRCRTASRTRSPRCGPGSPRAAPRPIACSTDVLAPLLRRDPEELRAQVCVGPAGHCAELLVALRRGRLRARVLLAAGRRAAPARADRRRSRAALSASSRSR